MIAATNIYKLVMMLALLESNYDTNAVGDNGEAIGELQVHKIMVREVNRLIGQKRFTYEDRWDRLKSRAMCQTFLIHQRKRWIEREGKEPTASQLMKSWNSGSIYKPCTKQYAARVQDILSKEN